MNSLFAIFAAFALLAPVASADLVKGSGADRDAPPATALQPREAPPPLLPRAQNQARIEERVIIRVAPSPPSSRARMLSQLPRRDMETSFQEVELKSCVPIRAIAGAAPTRQNRLLLFMRDRRVLSAALDKACDAQAFYSGFYVERNEDGLLCSGRDTLQSRAGASCGVSRFNRLVAVRD